LYVRLNVFSALSLAKQHVMERREYTGNPSAVPVNTDDERCETDIVVTPGWLNSVGEGRLPEIIV
jgi:hypothetical protein